MKDLVAKLRIKLAALLLLSFLNAGATLSSTTPSVNLWCAIDELPWPCEGEPLYTDSSFTITNTGSAETYYVVTSWFLIFEGEPMYGEPQGFDQTEVSGTAGSGNTYHEKTTQTDWWTSFNSSAIGNCEFMSLTHIEDSARNVVSSEGQDNLPIRLD